MVLSSTGTLARATVATTTGASAAPAVAAWACLAERAL